MSLRFKRVTEAHAPLILKWRTDPDITRFMYTDLENPSVEKQVAWIRSLQARPDYFAYVICDDETPVGFLSFAEYDPFIGAAPQAPTSTNGSIVSSLPRRCILTSVRMHFIDFNATRS